ncbi:MAG: 5-(carboxyamino)imidazole ribonucleotide synthase [Geodermatophilaceae bacterium]|nr:5-(carboxyamino)imidazole ribonucleotide synthase [Geodermatophilaceae bacterium]MDQ3477463.1 5-(carboxyamino)imidazole ribonucleotide synthase [Actinomycetota bacterium]
MDPRTGLPVVGMVGAGQLARMTHQAAIPLGQSLRVLAESPQDGAALVAADVVIGTHTSYEDLLAFAAGCDVLTFDHEHVPTELIRSLAEAGHAVYPGADALVHAQDKAVLREALVQAGIPGPSWSRVSTVDHLVAFGAQHGWPVVLKVARGGYDGRGVWFLSESAAASHVLDGDRAYIVEQRVPILRELAVLVARSPYGQVSVWPIVQTVQRDGICVEVIAPAPELSEEVAGVAATLAVRLAAELGVVGVMAVELFETGHGLLVNELAMRPHNSGHWTIEGSRTSQFEQHLRAVLDYPLGTTTMTAPWVVMANLLGGPDGGMGIDERAHHAMAQWPDVKLHLYGKSSRPGRKLGHVTALGSDLAEVRARAQAAVSYLHQGGHP